MFIEVVGKVVFLEQCAVGNPFVAGDQLSGNGGWSWHNWGEVKVTHEDRSDKDVLCRKSPISSE